MLSLPLVQLFTLLMVDRGHTLTRRKVMKEYSTVQEKNGIVETISKECWIEATLKLSIIIEQSNDDACLMGLCLL